MGNGFFQTTGNTGMRGRLTKLLTTATLFAMLFTQKVASQCALITDNYSGQVTNSVCAPVDLSMDVRYKFMLPVDPSHVQILYVWNDGTGATTQVPAISQGDSIFTATATHIYPPADQCSYTAEAYVVFDGQQCVSSSRQEQTFSAWARDVENGAVVTTDPVVAQFCEGEDIVDVRFRDNSTFNCNINIEPDKPNRITRWVQFIYGTHFTGGDRIPNITIRDPLGNVYQMTDAMGNSLPPVAGPIVEIPIPADGPTEISWPISAPAGGVAGDIFEITLRNWNICNPYDRNPFDAIPPSNLENGDNAPVTTQAFIEIITTPPEITNPSLEFCAGSPINLTLSTSGGNVTWYSDSLLTPPAVHTGNNFDPTGPPTNIDNSVGGTYSFWVTEAIGACASAPGKVSFRIFDTPAPAANAGNDAIICSDAYTLQGNTAVIGTGRWTTTSTTHITDPLDPRSAVTNLQPGQNLFHWTITNGPCISDDVVSITRDMQPFPAFAGPDQQLCDDAGSVLAGDPPTANGIGTWSVADGNAFFNNIHNAHTTATMLEAGENRLVWTIQSQFGVCNTSRDTVQILRDLTPAAAYAGPDRGVCDSVAIRMVADSVINGGMGTWSIVTGSAVIQDIHDPATLISGLTYGNTQLRWTITSHLGICAGSTDNVLIRSDEAPDPANAGPDQNLCSSISAPLGANSATIGNSTWSVISNPSGVMPVFNPSATSPNTVIQILPGNEGIYQLTWNIVNGSCRTTDTVAIDFGLPVVPSQAGIDDTVCGTFYRLTGNDPGIGTGTWRQLSGNGVVRFVPNNHSPTATAQIPSNEDGAYTFEYRITSGSCPPTADTVTIYYKPRPGNPVLSDKSQCGPGSVTLTSTPGSNGVINRWYDNLNGGPVLAESNTFLTPNLTNSTDYWVSTYDPVTGCESFREQVIVNVYPIPDPPIMSDIQHCGNASLEVTGETGNNGSTKRWYNAAIAGTMIGQADTLQTPVLSAPITYWVTSYNSISGCESSNVPVHIQIDPVPAIPVTADTSRCGEGAVTINASIGTNGTQNLWFNVSSGGAPFDSTENLGIAYLNSTTSYWVSTLNESSGCQSPRIRVTAYIHSVPGFPIVSDVTQCGPDTLSLSSLPGIQGTISRWYDSLSGGSLLFQGNNYIPGFISTTKRYYVSTYNETTHCESSRRPITAAVLPLPAAANIIGPSVVGIGQTNVIYSVNYQPGSTYQWNVPPGMGLLLENQNFVIVDFPNLGNYNLIVTEINSVGCEGPPAIKPIEVKADLIILDINTTQAEACEHSPLQLSVNPSGGTPSYTFQWGGDIQYLNAADVSNPVFSAPVAGNYMVTVTVNDINSNQSSDTIQVTVHSNPVAGIIAPDTVVCAGNDLDLHAQVSGGSGIYTSYLWSGDIAPLSSSGITDPTFNTYLRGYYRLRFTVTDTYGCMANDSIGIMNDSPLAAFNSNAAPGCSPLPVNFTNVSNNAVSYLWDFGDGNTSSDQDPLHTFLNQSNSVQHRNVVLTATSINGCKHATNGYVTVYPNPVLEIYTYPETACAPADILLSSTPGGYDYHWNFGDGNISTGGFTTMHTFENTTDHDTSFLIQLVSTSYFGCQDSGSAVIIVHPSPIASFTADPQSQMIPDRTVQFVNTTAGNWDFIWKYGDHTTSSDRNPGSHEYPGPGDYLAYLIVKGNYCSDSTWASIEILPHPPIAAFRPVEPGCMPLTIQFENTSAYSNSFLWEFGDGAVSNKPNPEYTYYEPGTYSIKLTAWGEDGTADSYSATNDVYVLPNAFFDAKPRRVYANEQPVLFENQSDNGSYPLDGNTYLWDFGDGNGSTEMSPTHMYNREGTYDVTLNVWTNQGCYDIYEYKTAVIVQPIGAIVFPNVFSPEAQLEENRIFKPGLIDFVEDYHLMIFNRWGELIFESFSQEVGWDGMADGKLAKEDVYIWKVEGTFTSGKKFVQTGDVTLLR